MLKIIGGLLVAWGVLDFSLSSMGTDLYTNIGITIPDAIREYTPYVVTVIGFVLISVARKKVQNVSNHKDGIVDSTDQSEAPLDLTENDIFHIKIKCDFSLESIQYILNEFIRDQGINSTHFIYQISERENIYAQGIWVGDANIDGKLQLEIVGKQFLTNPELLDKLKLRTIISYGWDRNSGVEGNFIREIKTQDCMDNHLAHGKYSLGATIILDSLKVFDIPKDEISPSYIIEQ